MQSHIGTNILVDAVRIDRVNVRNSVLFFDIILVGFKNWRFNVRVLIEVAWFGSAG
jgi:hypothetical protein